MRDKPKIWWLRYECHTTLRTITDTVEFHTIGELEDALEAIAADDSGEYLLAACGERTQLPGQAIAVVPRSWVLFREKPKPRRVAKATDLETGVSEAEDLFAAYKNQINRLDRMAADVRRAERRHDLLRFLFVLTCAFAGAAAFNWWLSR